MSGMRHNSEAICGNWIAVSREMRDHYLVGFGQPVKPADPKKGAFSRAEAWLDLIMLARWKDGQEMNRGRKIDMLAGQIQGGYSFLASRWNWTIKTVRGFLGKLMGEQMVAETGSKEGRQSSNQVQVLTVCNYKRYQLVSELLAMEEGQAKGRQRASEGQHLNTDTLPSDTTYPQDTSDAAQSDLLGDVPKQPSVKGAKQKPRTRKTPPGEYTHDFDCFWKIYPRKEAKGESFASWQRLTMEQRRRAYAALKKQLAALTAKLNERGRNVCPLPSTWINQGRFDDELEATQAARPSPVYFNGRRDINAMTPAEYEQYLEHGYA